MLRNPVFITILIVLALLPAACGTQEKKPSQDVLLAEGAFAQMERLRQAYSARDMSALQALCSGEAYESIRKGMKDFRSVELEFEPKWMNITAEGVLEVQVAWDGNWLIKGEDSGVRDRGRAVFVLGGSRAGLMEIKGASPFEGPSGSGLP
jgi:hypothetical protein